MKYKNYLAILTTVLTLSACGGGSSGGGAGEQAAVATMPSTTTTTNPPLVTPTTPVAPTTPPAPPAEKPCAAGSLNWIIGNDTCNAAVAETASGLLAKLLDTTAPITGNATYACSKGVWSIAASPAPTCIAAILPPPPSTPDCPDARLTWSVAPAYCAAQASITKSGSQLKLSDAVGLNTGSATFSCNSGVWTQAATPAATCVLATPLTGNSLTNDGDKFIVTYQPYTAGTVTEYRLYSMRNPNDPPRAMISRSVTPAPMNDPYVYDGVHVYYKVYAVVADNEIEIYKADGVQPDRQWTDSTTPVVVSANNTVLNGNYRSLKKNGCHTAIVINPGVTGTVIENARIASCGDGVAAASNNTIEIKGTRAWGLHPQVQNSHHGKFFSALRPISLLVENNYMETWHFNIYYDSKNTAPQKVSIRFNKMRNLQGLKTNAQEGSYRDKRYPNPVGHPIQSNSAHGSPDTDVSWNEIVQEPSIGFSEDIINHYRSSGTAGNHAKIHDNLIYGGYATEPEKKPGSARPPFDQTKKIKLNGVDVTVAVNEDGQQEGELAREGYGLYSGCGIISDGGEPGDGAIHGNLDVFKNIVIATSNCGIGMASGTNMLVYENRMVSSGLLEDGRIVWAQNNGLYVSKQSGGDLTNITATNNFAYWDRQPGSIFHPSAPAGGGGYFAYDNSTPGLKHSGDVGGEPNGKATIQTERDAYQLFWKRVRDAGVKIGITSH